MDIIIILKIDYAIRFAINLTFFSILDTENDWSLIC